MTQNPKASPESTRESRTFWIGMALSLGSSVLWGSTYTVIEVGLKYYNPYQISYLRALFATLTLLAVYIFNRKTGELLVLPKDRLNWGLFVSASFLGSAGFWTLLNLSVQYLKADTASFVTALYPLIAVVLASVVLKEKMTFGRATGVLIGIFGAYLIVAFGENAKIEGAQPLIGIMIALVTAFSFGGYIIVSRILIGRKDTKSGLTFSATYVTLVTFAIAIIPTLLFAIASAPFNSLFNTNATAIFAILYLGIGSSGIAFLIFNMGMKIVGAGRAAVNQLLFPVVSIVTSFFVLRETINLPDGLGIFLILFGILVAQRIRLR